MIWCGFLTAGLYNTLLLDCDNQSAWCLTCRALNLGVSQLADFLEHCPYCTRPFKKKCSLTCGWPETKWCGCVFSLKAALDSAMSLELGPKGLLVFEDYAKGNTSSSQLAQRKGIPGAQTPQSVHTIVSCALALFILCILWLSPSASEAHTAAPRARHSHQHQCHCLLEGQSWRYHRLLPSLLHGRSSRR